MKEKLSFRNAERKDTPLILEFIQNLAQDAGTDHES